MPEQTPTPSADDFGDLMNRRFRSTRGSTTGGYTIPADHAAINRFLRGQLAGPENPAAEGGAHSNEGEE